MISKLWYICIIDCYAAIRNYIFMEFVMPCSVVTMRAADTVGEGGSLVDTPGGSPGAVPSPAAEALVCEAGHPGAPGPRGAGRCGPVLADTLWAVPWDCRPSWPRSLHQTPALSTSLPGHHAVGIHGAWEGPRSCPGPGPRYGATSRYRFQADPRLLLPRG